ncbi:MAG: RnfC Barrel sandwich hybrid domain, partial [Nitrospirae bacterium]|nr:RnfC Barrel sandwich hybrid domain [Nitrospirota bacterium]
ILLKQHVGAPSVPVVKVGDQVQQGQLVAEIAKDMMHPVLRRKIGDLYEALKSVKQD